MTAKYNSEQLTNLMEIKLSTSIFVALTDTQYWFCIILKPQ